MSYSDATGLVSVMMPAYNAEKFIARAIESVEEQSYENWELIIVDDGSTDRTAKIAATYGDARIKLLRQANGGEAVARNTALANMSGEFVAFLDADDEFLPNHLEITCEFMTANANRDGVYTDGFYVDTTGQRLQTLSSRRRGPFEGRIFEELVRASDVFGPPICVVLRRSSVVDTGLCFDPEIVIGPDWDFMTRFSQHTRFGYVNEATCLYRVHTTNITVRTGNQARVRYLALCRSKAIELEGFDSLSVETRTAVFYDLLVVLLAGEQTRQTEILQGPAFLALPTTEQAKLKRLLASAEIVRGGQPAYAQQWIADARRLNSADTKSAALSFMYKISPRVTTALLRTKYMTRPTSNVSDEPFGGLP